MLEHERPGRWVERVSQDRDDEDDGEERYVEHEEHNAESLQRMAMARIQVGECVEKDGDDTCTHRNGKLIETLVLCVCLSARVEDVRTHDGVKFCTSLLQPLRSAEISHFGSD